MDDGGLQAPQFAHAVVTVAQSHVAVAAGEVVVFLQRDRIDALGEHPQQRTRPPRGLPPADAQSLLLELGPCLRVGDPRPRVEDRDDVSAFDLATGESSEGFGEVVGEHRGLGEPCLDRAVRGPHRTRELRGDLPQRQIDPPRIPRSCAAHDRQVHRLR
ncbi:hypothetical protein OAW74_13335 [Microbacterium fluvii]|nr:hypothetical protein [Microbacterium fluvii]MCU4673576.1 hypothetical protein [Microbacterium fluvii]